MSEQKRMRRKVARGILCRRQGEDGKGRGKEGDKKKKKKRVDPPSPVDHNKDESLRPGEAVQLNSSTLVLRAR